jgi:DNA polymerase III delta prime subunit
MTCRGSLFDGVRVVLLDEADYLTKEAQAGLRGAMEDYSRLNMYVFTANHADRLINALHSRLMPMDFSLLKGDSQLREEMLLRVREILDAENVELDLQSIRSLINIHAPDMRQILKRLQYEAVLAV